MHIYIYIYICICIHIHMYTYIYTYVCIYTYTYMYIYNTHAHIHTRAHTHNYTCPSSKGLTIIFVEEHNYMCRGTQLYLPVFEGTEDRGGVEEHNYICRGTQLYLSRNTIICVKEHNYTWPSSKGLTTEAESRYPKIEGAVEVASRP